ncbi:hypothetical protein QBC98_002860 [Kitasatospora acidiphila]
MTAERHDQRGHCDRGTADSARAPRYRRRSRSCRQRVKRGPRTADQKRAALRTSTVTASRPGPRAGSGSQPGSPTSTTPVAGTARPAGYRPWSSNGSSARHDPRPIRRPRPHSGRLHDSRGWTPSPTSPRRTGPTSPCSPRLSHVHPDRTQAWRSGLSANRASRLGGAKGPADRDRQGYDHRYEFRPGPTRYRCPGAGAGLSGAVLRQDVRPQERHGPDAEVLLTSMQEPGREGPARRAPGPRAGRFAARQCAGRAEADRRPFHSEPSGYVAGQAGQGPHRWETDCPAGRASGRAPRTRC